MKIMKNSLTFLCAFGCLATGAHAASFVKGDATASLGSDYLIDEASLGGSDATQNEPNSFQMTRNLIVQNAGEDGSLIEITGIAFALPNASAVIDATELEITITHLGSDDTFDTADDVLLGSETVTFAFDGVGEYYAIFDTPMTGTVDATVLRYRIQIAPKNDAGEGSLRLKAAVLAFETFTGPKLTLAGTSTAVGAPILLDADNDGLADSVETGTGVFVSATDTGTAPFNRDTDNDGLSDGFEVEVGLDAHDHLADLDGDNFTDADEVHFYGTDPDDAAEFPGDGQNAGPMELTPILEFGTRIGAELMPLPPMESDPLALGSAILNEAAQGGNDVNHPAGLTNFSVVYSELFESAETPVSITGFGLSLIAAGTVSGDMLVEFYDPAAADGDDDFDGIDAETKVGSATGTLTIGATGVYYWAFAEPVTFTSAGRSLAVRFVFSESVRLKAQDNFGSGVRYSNQGGGAFTTCLLYTSPSPRD